MTPQRLPGDRRSTPPEKLDTGRLHDGVTDDHEHSEQMRPIEWMVRELDRFPGLVRWYHYLRGDAEIHLHFVPRRGVLDGPPQCAVYERSIDGVAQGGAGNDCLTYKLWVDGDDGNDPMLRSIVESVEMSEASQPGGSVVRLQPLDECLRSWDHSGDLIQAAAACRLARLPVDSRVHDRVGEDRKLGKPTRVTDPGECPSEMIERRPEFVYEGPDLVADPQGGQFSAEVNMDEFLRFVRVELGPKHNGIGLLEGADFSLELHQLLVRSIQLESDSVQGIGSRGHEEYRYLDGEPDARGTDTSDGAGI